MIADEERRSWGEGVEVEYSSARGWISAQLYDRRITRRREIVRDRKSRWTYSVPICARFNEQDRRRPVPALKRQMQRRVACVGRDKKSGQCLARGENGNPSPS